QRVADHSEPRIAWRGCAIGPIISNRRPCWSMRIFERAAVTFGTIDQRFAAFSGESLMASVPMCRKIPTLRTGSREAGIALFPRHRCEQPLALDLQDVGH